MMRGETGFVLAATLWVLALMAIGAGYISTWTADALQQAREQVGHVEASIDMGASFAVLLYLLGTRPLTEAGLSLPNAEQPFSAARKSTDPFERVAFDGPVLSLADRIYKGSGDSLFSLQDEGGLIGVNTLVSTLAQNVLSLKGVSSADRIRLMARLQDYTDADDLYRLNGAEKQEYLKAGLPPPSNRNLLTPWEVAAVMGWKQQESLWRPQPIPRLLTSVWSSLPNFNTSPRQVLQSWSAIRTDEAKKVVAGRVSKPYRRRLDVERQIGRKLLLNQADHKFFPSNFIRITLWAEKESRVQEVHLQLTPFADEAQPWLVDYKLEYPKQMLAPLEKSHDPPTLMFGPDYGEKKKVSLR